ncbi:MAG: preprotein translocase subunit SecG [Moraxellaceae bacterium]|nr:preprotein translocase subunit SecG [Moraxellaceae bacterium]
MFNFILAIQIIVAIAMVGLILLQHGKGADAGASFGSGASGTVFGAAGSANFLTRATAVLTAIFFATSLLLAIQARQIETDQRSLNVADIETETVIPAPDDKSVETETAEEILTEADTQTKDTLDTEKQATETTEMTAEQLEQALAKLEAETEKLNKSK